LKKETLLTFATTLFILHCWLPAEFVSVMSRDIREFDNENDLRTAWKVFDKVRLQWPHTEDKGCTRLNRSSKCMFPVAGKQGVHQHF
jgi:hypothetical protein